MAEMEAVHMVEKATVEKDSNKRKNIFHYRKPKPEIPMNRNDKPPDNRKSDPKDHSKKNNLYRYQLCIHNWIYRRNKQNCSCLCRCISCSRRNQCLPALADTAKYYSRKPADNKDCR